MANKIQTRNISNNVDLKFESEPSEKNNYLDTKVSVVNGDVLCWICYEDIDKFTQEMKNVIDKYRI